MSEEIKRPTANDGWSGDAMCYGAEEADAYVDSQDARIERLTDLVRHQRFELHQERLISDEEFAELTKDSGGGNRVACLEGYDSMRNKIASLESTLAILLAPAEHGELEIEELAKRDIEAMAERTMVSFTEGQRWRTYAYFCSEAKHRSARANRNLVKLLEDAVKEIQNAHLRLEFDKRTGTKKEK